MIELIETIVNDWSKTIPSGVIDTKNDEHLYSLLEALNKNIDNPKIVRAVMENIREQMRESY